MLQNSFPPWNKCLSEDQDFVASDDYLATSKVVDEFAVLLSAFSERLLRVVVSRVSTTSKIMLGDLSRHYVGYRKLTARYKQAYRNFSVMYQSIARSQLQTICSNKI